MILFISGPMRGHEDFNFPNFFKAEKAIEKLGHIAINPARHDKANGFDEKRQQVSNQYLRDVMAWDLGQVCRADGIVVLSGWHSSKGSRAEVAAARAIGLPVYLLINREGIVSLREAHYAGT